MKTKIESIFCPVTASEARKMANQGEFRLISVADFPRGAPLHDKRHRMAYFAVEGTDGAFRALTKRVVDRLNASEPGRPRDALLGAMAAV